MRRILHIIDSLKHTGAASQLNVLAQRLTREGFEVQVVALDAVGRRWAIDPLAFWRLARFIRRFQPDVVHTWDLNAAIYASAALARLPQRWRDRVRARGLGPRRPCLVIGLYRIEPWMPGWQWFMTRRLARQADRLVTSSPKVREWYAAGGLPADKFSVIPVGVPAPRPSQVSRDELLRELQMPADARLIGVIARLVPENRVKDLIWAADLLRVLHNNLRLLVIGDGPWRSQLEEYARLASDLDHIQFLGDRSDVWRIMPHLDVLWNASENVGPSAAILEAMAAGVPVIASDTPTNRELVVENETGYLIPRGTRAGRAARARHTDRIFIDAELVARLATAARQRIAERFSAEQMVQRYGELYCELVIN